MFDLTIQDFDGEPRALDLDIAQILGFTEPKSIRKLIKRHEDSLLSFGGFRDTMSLNPLGGRPQVERWLNEEQVLYICTKSATSMATEITIAMVKVFSAWRAGRLVAAPGDVDLPPDADVWRGLIREARLLFGRAVARDLWRQSPLPQVPALDVAEVDAGPTAAAVMRRFLGECCQVTGSQADFTLSADLVAALGRWMADTGLPPWSEGKRAKAIGRAARHYRAPNSGARFRPHKRSVSGYLGIRIVRVDAVIE